MEVCWQSRLLLSLRMLQSTQLLVCGTANAGCVVCWEASQCPYAWPGKFHAWHPKSVGVKVSPPSLDGQIAACKYTGNHVPPPLEISRVPETLCWEGALAWRVTEHAAVCTEERLTCTGMLLFVRSMQLLMLETSPRWMCCYAYAPVLTLSIKATFSCPFWIHVCQGGRKTHDAGRTAHGEASLYCH
jgi:hypothetical protein